MAPIPTLLSASLLHEVRMIVQSYLRTRENETFWKSRSPRRQAAPPQPVLKCVVCLRLKAMTPKPAVTIDKGNAVCETHVIV